VLQKLIKVDIETRDALTALKKGNDTYNDVIKRLIAGASIK